MSHYCRLQEEKKHSYPNKMAKFPDSPGNFSPTSEFEHLLEWVCLGASHVRNNLACVEKHQQSLRTLGETEKRLSELDYWRESLRSPNGKRPP